MFKVIAIHAGKAYPVDEQRRPRHRGRKGQPMTRFALCLALIALILCGTACDMDRTDTNDGSVWDAYKWDDDEPYVDVQPEIDAASTRVAEEAR